jgi:hypothetical protein
MTSKKRPQLHPPLALLAGRPGPRPNISFPPRLAPFELRRLVAAMVD